MNMTVLSDVKSKIRLSYFVVGLSATYLLCYVISSLLHTQHSHALEFTPANVFTGSFWQLFTAGFTENYGINVIVNIAILVTSNRFLEPVWGTFEYAKFVVIINVSTYILNLFIYFVGYVALREESFLYAPFCGGHGLMAGILVGLKQLIPDHLMVRTVAPLRVRHLPLLSFFFTLFCTLTRFTSTRYLTVNIAGLATAWIYLRYFQLHERGRGDFSDALSLASFFPEFAQPYVIDCSVAVTTRLETLFQKNRISSKTINLTDLSSNLTISTESVTERRRQLALQALNERLQTREDTDWSESDTKCTEEASESSPLTEEV